MFDSELKQACVNKVQGSGLDTSIGPAFRRQAREFKYVELPMKRDQQHRLQASSDQRTRIIGIIRYFGETLPVSGREYVPINQQQIDVFFAPALNCWSCHVV